MTPSSAYLYLQRVLTVLVLFTLSHVYAQNSDNDTRNDASPDTNQSGIRVWHANNGEIVEIGRDLTIKEGQSASHVVVIAGNAIIDGDIEHDLVVISGNATVNGTIGGQLTVVLGSVTLGPKAVLERGTVVVGGKYTADPAATVDGDHVVVSFGSFLGNIEWLQGWLGKGLLFGRPFPPQFGWVWVVAGVFLLAHLLLSVAFPRPVRASVKMLEQQPIASFFIGILCLTLFGPLIFLMVVSVVGILIIPFLICALIAGCLFGKVGVYAFAGQQISHQLRNPSVGLPLALILGSLVFYLLYMVPVIGFITWGLASVLGLGAVLMAMFAGLRQSDAPVYTAVAPRTRVNTANPSPSSTVPPTFAESTSFESSESSGAATATATATSAPPLTSAADVVLLARVGFWRRFLATLLDFILLGIILSLTGPAFLLIWCAYYVGMWTWKGTSIGGIITGIKIVRMDGKPIDFAVALVRSLSSFFSALALFLGFFWAGWDKEKQAWHDKIAGTVVVRVPKGISLV